MQIIEEGLGGGNGESGDLADILIVDEHGASFGAQALAAAVGAERVAPVLGEEDTDVQLILLALQRREEATNAGERAAAVLDEALLFGGQVVPRNVGGHACGLSGAEHLAMMRAILGRSPRRNGTLPEALRFVRNDEVGIEVDGVAEALAARTCAEGIVEREETRLRLAIGAMAASALERCRESQVLRLAFALAGNSLELHLSGLAGSQFRWRRQFCFESPD